LTLQLVVGAVVSELAPTGELPFSRVIESYLSINQSVVGAVVGGLDQQGSYPFPAW